MKKLFYILAAGALILGAASCEKKEKVTTNEQGLVDDGGKKLTADEQKTKVEETADAIMNSLDPKVWQAEFDRVNEILDEVSNANIDLGEVEAAVDAITAAWETIEEKDNMTVYTTIARLSDIKGHFTQQADGSFAKEDASDLKVTFTAAGKTVVLSAVFKDRNEKVLIADRIIEGNRFDYDGDGIIDFYGDDEEKVTYLYVPESADLAITVNGEKLASLKVTLDYVDGNKESEIVDPATDKLNFGLELGVGAYSLKVEEAYTGTSVSLKESFLCNGKTVISTTSSADVAFTGNGFQDASNAKVEIDLAGIIQLKGNLPSSARIEEAADKVDRAIEANDKNAIVAALAELEKLYGFGIYYDGKSTLQATLGFEVVENEGRYDALPVVRFADGTSYGMADFSQDQRMADLVARVNAWMAEVSGYLQSSLPQAEPVAK